VADSLDGAKAAFGAAWETGALGVANKEHVERLKQGVDAWNLWRSDILTGLDLSHTSLCGAMLRGADLRLVDLSRADLRGTDLSDANLNSAGLSAADLSHANLSDANLKSAVLSLANLSDANLQRAWLRYSDLSGAKLNRANLTGARLSETDLGGTDLSLANFTDVLLRGTFLINIDLANVIGLATCEHLGPSFIDHQTLQRSGPLPIPFLRGIGLPDALVEYFGKAVQYYSCFISYSAKDDDFAKHLHADLENNGVRCWFAPHDLPIGEKILDSINAAIRLRDKVLLVLSEHSIGSEWVEDEVTKGFEEERKRGQIVLFPVRLDNAVMTTTEAWAVKVRARNIGDFLRWKDHDAYKQSLDRVLRELKHPTKG
jgi:hypothetical protein